MALLKANIKTQANRKHFFARFIRGIRLSIGCTQLSQLKAMVNPSDEREFPEPLKACKLIRTIIGNLGLRCLGDDRKCFDRLQEWYIAIPMQDHDRIELYAWIDKLQLQELPKERINRLPGEAQQNLSRIHL